LKLIETLLVLDHEAGVQDTGATFTEHMLNSYADRSLTSLIVLSTRTGSLAARCLRLLVQYAPYYRCCAFGLVQHFPTLSALLKLSVNLSSNPSLKDVVSQIMRVEVALTVALCLAQDPRCRQILSSQLHDHAAYMQQLRASLLSNLNGAALDYYGDIDIVDVTGELVNDTAKVVWESSGRPSRMSIQRVLEDQEARWSTFSHDAPRNPKPMGRKDSETARLERLTFILLSYSVHSTLTRAREDHAGPAEPESVALPQGTSRASSQDEQDPPLAQSNPTRASMLREWRTHPDKFQVLRRAVSRNANAMEGPRAAPAGSTEPPEPSKSHAHPKGYLSNFVDPLSRPTPRSFKPVPVEGLSPKRALFSKFECAMQLCTTFAQYFNKGGEHSVIFEKSRDGFVRRQPRPSVSLTAANAAPSTAKYWTVQHLKEGDLFYFSIPFVQLSQRTLEQVRARAIRHLNVIKKSFIVTPHALKCRRWFLYDMTTHIMPGVIHSLSQLVELFAIHGEEEVKFPILLFREAELAAVDQSDEPMDEHQGLQAVSLHCGNLLEVIDQVRFYFIRLEERKDGQHSTMTSGSPKSERRKTFLRDLERRIDSLSKIRFTGEEGMASAASTLMQAGNDDAEESTDDD
jgi:hypothetical protein